ncbi:MAG TPA: DinB family protein [Blastocatellia bacterium]|nr:DinB family protein [Blastocatellia bacterium]
MDQREKEQLLWNLRSLPNELIDLVDDLDEETLRWRPIPNKWSVKEALCHLRDIERELFLSRYQAMLREHEPVLVSIDPDRIALERDYIKQDAQTALAEFTRARADVVRLLESAPVDAWARRGVHRTRGLITIEQTVASQKDHDLNHLFRIKDVVRLKMPW